MGRRRRAHLDASAVISIVTRDERVRDAQKTLYDLAEWDYEPVVTQVVAGGALAVLTKRHRDPRVIDDYVRRTINVLKRYRISAEDCVVPVAAGPPAIAVRPNGMDGRMAGNGPAMVAQAPAGPDSAVPVTTDGVPLDSKAVSRPEAELHGDSGGRSQRTKVAGRAP